MTKKPDTCNSLAQKELDKAEKQFEAYEQNIKELTLDRMNEAPVKEVEQQTKLSQTEIEKSKDLYLKPKRSLSSREKFNEKFREDYNYSKEYVHFIAEHREIIGESIELWTKPYPGMPVEEWEVPTNKPVWGPRYLAERIKSCKYHRMTMNQSITNGSDQKGNQYYGAMVVDSTIQRLDAYPVDNRRSIFMNAGKF